MGLLSYIQYELPCYMCLKQILVIDTVVFPCILNSESLSTKQLFHPWRSCQGGARQRFFKWRIESIKSLSIHKLTQTMIKSLLHCYYNSYNFYIKEVCTRKGWKKPPMKLPSEFQKTPALAASQTRITCRHAISINFQPR